MNDNKPHHIMQYWQLIVAAIGIAVTWGTVTTQLNDIEVRVGVNTARIEASAKEYNALTNQITELKTILQERLPGRK